MMERVPATFVVVPLEQREVRNPQELPVALGSEAETRRQFDLPLALFEDLLSAFSQDVTKRRYQTDVELIDYCRRSANPIGRLILLLFGYRDQQLHRWSDDICTALQLANHWQDVAVDLAKDRIYLPAEDLERFGVSEQDLERGRRTPNLIELLRFEADRARRYYHEAMPLVEMVHERSRPSLRALISIYSRLLDRIEQSNYDVFTRRVSLSPLEKSWIVVRSALARS